MAVSYTTGTVSVNNADTAVTGSGTNWATSGIQPGDQFRVAGQTVRIASVNSNTSITLAYAWPGTTVSGGSYEVYFLPDNERFYATALSVLNALTSGIITAFAALSHAADKLAYSTGSGTMALIDFKGWVRTFIGAADAAGGRTALGVPSNSEAVLVTGTQTVAGVKTFSSAIRSDSGIGIGADASGSTQIIITKPGGSAQISASSESSTALIMYRATDVNTGTLISMRKSRGTIAAPALPVTNDTIGTIEWRSWTTGTTFSQIGLFGLTVTEATPSAAAQGTQLFWSAAAAGTVSSSVIARLDWTNGLQLMGSNVVIDANRHFRPRSYTVATLPSASPATQMIYVSDGTSNKRLAVSDGTNWRFADGNIVS